MVKGEFLPIPENTKDHVYNLSIFPARRIWRKIIGDVIT